MLCTYLFAQPSWRIYMSKTQKCLLKKLKANWMCGSKNYPYLPRRRYFSLDPPPPHLSGNSSQASYIYANFWAFENPPPPRNFQSLPWGEYGYFLELHIVNFPCLLALVVQQLGLGDKGN